MPITRYTPAQQLTYGRPEYQEALADWRKSFGNYSQMLQQLTPQLASMMSYYQPGGGYGAGQRSEAERLVKSGLSKDMATMVGTGMSSGVASRGLQTRANAELARMFANIEDTRNQLWQQSVGPYAQIISQMANMAQSRPTFGQYFQTGAKIPESVVKL